MQPENLVVAKEWDTTTTPPRRVMADSFLELAWDMSDTDSFAMIDVLKLVASKPWSMEWKLFVFSAVLVNPCMVKKASIPELEEVVLG